MEQSCIIDADQAALLQNKDACLYECAECVHAPEYTPPIWLRAHLHPIY